MIGRGSAVLEPLAGLVGGPEPRLPDGGRVAVEGGDRPGPEVTGQAAERVGHDRRSPSAPGRPTSRSISSSGMSGEIRACPGQREGPGGRQPEGPGERGLGVRPGGVARAAQPGHDQGQPVGNEDRLRPPAAGPAGIETISSAVTPGIPTSAKPTELRELTGAGRVWSHAHADDGDAEGGEGPGGKGDDLAGRGPGRRARAGRSPGRRPSKVRVTFVIDRSGSPVWGWTRLSDPVVTGSEKVDLPPLPDGPREGVGHQPSACCRRARPPAGPRGGR